ncbi:MAG: DUF1707 domain-containing protein [Rhodococcus sp. (in: high G+C Gram-positive bacteria)]|uniref:DUF1707 SHOCT-like domain-containing protein n=1 Tax=Rhodococcus TaxID=1827 RepID=UPI00132A372D|nr:MULTISPECIES: DUF1707 domain-containing protein [Rhodococcus]MXQ75395.1 DUF1707 domain-containing protein [Rhodococcus rhodochrous]
MPEHPDIRIGNAERSEALDLLGEHFALGRLTLSEFDERSAKASAATTRGDLQVLFTDLPAHLTDSSATTRDDLPVIAPKKDPERWREVVMGLTPLVALVLFFAFDSWLFFLLIPAMGIVLFAGRDRDGHSTEDGSTNARRDEKKNA